MKNDEKCALALRMEKLEIMSCFVVFKEGVVTFT